MNRKFTQGWSTISPISTKLSTTSHPHSVNTKEDHDRRMTLWKHNVSINCLSFFVSSELLFLNMHFISLKVKLKLNEYKGF